MPKHISRPITVLLPLLMAAIFAACHHSAGVENARAVKACVLTELQSDTTAAARRLYAFIDSLPLTSTADCSSFYEQLNGVTDEMESPDNGIEVSVIMRNILDILHDADHRSVDDTREMLILYARIGAVFTDMGMPTIGIDYYMTGLKYCRDSIYDNYKAMLCNNLGIIYAERAQADRAEEYFQRALHINQRRNNHHATFINYGNLTELYALQGETEKALETSQRSLDYLDQRNRPDHLASMRIQQGVLYTRLGQYDMALLRYNSGLNQYIQLADARGIISGYLHIADNFLQWGMPDSAMVYATEARRLCRHYERDEDMTSALKTLAQVYQAKGQHEHALTLMNEMTALSDSIRSAENSLRMANWEGLSNAIIPEQHHKPDKTGLWLTVAIIAIAGLLILSVAFYLRLRHEHLKSLRMAADNDKQFALALDKLNRELTTLSLEKLKLHEGLTEICDGLRSVLLEMNPRETAKRDNIRTQLNRLNALSDYDADEEFKLYFERVHPEFYQKLARLDAELTARDLRLCALLYLGLTTKEIATLTYREVRSVESARNRLRKKLGLELSDDLTAYLRSVA